MTCNSEYVQAVADKSVATKDQIEKLQERIEELNDQVKSDFFEEMATYLNWDTPDRRN
jgi:hypothetical protein